MVSASVVIGLLVGSGAVYLVAASQISSLQASLSSATESNTMLHAELQNGTVGVALTLQPGQMIRSAWLFIAPVGKGQFAVSLHAEGLKLPSSGGYLIEGVTRQGAKMVPLGPTEIASEFDATNDGVGTYWLVLNQNPSTTYQTIVVLYLAGMQMSNAVLVASAALG